MAVNEEDKDIESVAQPGAESEKSIKDLELRALIRAENRDYERLKELENEGKIGVDGGNALVNQVGNKKDDDGDEKKKGGFSAFVSSVGDALTGVVSGVENKMEAIYEDPKKRRNFLQGLNTIIKSSGYTPISQAKSPVGMIAEGQKQGFLEDLAIRQKERGLDIERLKALKNEKRVADPKDKVIADMFLDYKKNYNDIKLLKYLQKELIINY